MESSERFVHCKTRERLSSDAVVRRVGTPTTLPDSESEEKGFYGNIFNKIQRGLHRINGVVGSGKTTFIAMKALEMANKSKAKQQDPFTVAEPSVLCLTLTISSASRIRHVLSHIDSKQFGCEHNDLKSSVEVKHIHKWYYDNYGEFLFDSSEGLSMKAVYKKYDAILFDEYHDAQLGWAPFLFRHLKNERPIGSLLLLAFDPAQGDPEALSKLLDEISNTARIDWKSRSFYLDKCIRIPRKIGEFAMTIHKQLTQQSFESIENADIARIMTRALRPKFIVDGGNIRIRTIDNLPEYTSPERWREEAMQIVTVLKEIQRNKHVERKDIAIITPPDTSKSGWWKDASKSLSYCFSQLGEQCYSINQLEEQSPPPDRRNNFFYRATNQVTLATAMRIKGLEIPIVVLTPSLIEYLGVGTPASKRAFYQAATRATDTLYLLGTKNQLDFLREKYQFKLLWEQTQFDLLKKGSFPISGAGMHSFAKTTGIKSGIEIPKKIAFGKQKL